MKKQDYLMRQGLACFVWSVLGATAVSGAYAQSTQIAEKVLNPTELPTTDKNGLQFDTVVVTGNLIGRSKMKTSVSVSTLDAEQIRTSSASNLAEILREIPGLRSESSGGEGNANFTVRGVPISAGGMRYVQFQEDGLPVLQFGDIAFATPDMFLRVDGSLSDIEVVRGGTASTLASNAPGGIVNFVSRHGQQQGGNIGVTQGLNFNQTRLDVDVGGVVADKTRAFIAGFYRHGQGARPSGVKVENGGQLKANITREFDQGFVRLYFKHLEDQVPMHMPVPVTTVAGHITATPGIDPRTASFYSPYWTQDGALQQNNRQHLSKVNDGLTVRSQSIGLEAEFDLGNQWRLEEKFRISQQSGRFIAIFPADNAKQATNMRYATGPNVGQAYTGAAFTAALFNTSLDDVGNRVNDLKVAKTIAWENNNLIVAAGLYSSQQKLAATWNFNHYLLQAIGEKPALLSATETLVGTTGLLARGTDVWGGCCNRYINATYQTNAPYLHVGWEQDAWNLDASLRQDRQHATGRFQLASNQAFVAGNSQTIDYTVAHLSHSIGANYRIEKGLAVFARHSEGIAMNADRIMFGNPLDGSTPINTNIVKQMEAGVKWRGEHLQSFLTAFQADTVESNFEASTQKFTANSYRAQGLELETSYHLGDFNLTGGLTYTAAHIVAANDLAVIGKSPRRQAKFVGQIAAIYNIDNAQFGLSMIGTGKSWGDDKNTIVLPGFCVVNAHMQYRINPRITVTLHINNLLNTIGYTEVEGDGHAARSINGMTARVGLRYAF